MSVGETVPMVLVIGGFDPSCSAGIVADARTVEACGGLPFAVPTAWTVQSGLGVVASEAIPARQVQVHLVEALENFSIAAVKIGQIPTAELVETVHAGLADWQGPVVLDPVIEASGGGLLMEEAAVDAAVELLFPRVTVLTPNREETRNLVRRALARMASSVEDASKDTGGDSGWDSGAGDSDKSAGTPVKVPTEESAAATMPPESDVLEWMTRAGELVATLGPEAVLVKGGQVESERLELLWRQGRARKFRNRRISISPEVRGPGSTTKVAVDMHGSGCALSSALATALAGGFDMEPAVTKAMDHARALIRNAQAPGNPARALRGPQLS